MTQDKFTTELREQIGVLAKAAEAVADRPNLKTLTHLQIERVKAQKLLQRIEDAEKDGDQPLWIFTFKTGGYNQVYARTLDAAIRIARKQLPTMVGQIDESSFRALRTKEQQDDYYRSIRLD